MLANSKCGIGIDANRGLESFKLLYIFIKFSRGLCFSYVGSINKLLDLNPYEPSISYGIAKRYICKFFTGFMSK